MKSATSTGLTVVRDVPERDRVEIEVDGALVGFAHYRRRPGTIAFVHTETDPGHEGEASAASSSPPRWMRRAEKAPGFCPSAPSCARTSSTTPSTSISCPPSGAPASGCRSMAYVVKRAPFCDGAGDCRSWHDRVAELDGSQREQKPFTKK